MSTQVPPKPTFDMQYPSGGQGYSSHNFLNAFQAIYAVDFLPCRPLAHDNPDLSIMVLGTDADSYQRGIYYGNNSQRISVASGDSPFMAAPSDYPRIDVVYMQTNGTIRVVTGTESQNPSIPELPSGDTLPICAIYHPTTTTRIANYADRDSYTGDSYILADLRPIYVMPKGQDSRVDEQNDQNTRNIMLNRLKIMEKHNLTRGAFVDGWADDFQDSTGIVLSSQISGDLVSSGDKRRYSRNYTHQGTPNFRVIHNLGSNTGQDGKAVIVGGKQAFDFLATKATIICVTASGDNITAEISRNSGDTWNIVPLTTDFYDGQYYYKSGVNESLAGAYAPVNSGDYYVTFVIPSGNSTTLDAYAVSLA